MTDAALSFIATVTDIRLESRKEGAARWQIALDHTLFSPAAPAGTLTAISAGGTRLEVPILQIVEDDGTIWHVVDKPLSAETRIFGTLSGPLPNQPG